MKNADLFKNTFGIYATEIWSMSEKEFLIWLNEDAKPMSDIFGESMEVREAIALLAYGTDYEIKGAYSGKIYHRSWVNKKEHAEKFYDETTIDNPFYATGRMSAITGTAYFSPVIGIWMHDYHLCKEPQKSEVSDADSD